MKGLRIVPRKEKSRECPGGVVWWQLPRNNVGSIHHAFQCSDDSSPLGFQLHFVALIFYSRWDLGLHPNPTRKAVPWESVRIIIRLYLVLGKFIGYWTKPGIYNCNSSGTAQGRWFQWIGRWNFLLGTHKDYHMRIWLEDITKFFFPYTRWVALLFTLMTSRVLSCHDVDVGMERS